MKFLINGMDFEIFNTLSKEDAEFIAKLESYDKYPIFWDYEELTKESLDLDKTFDYIATEAGLISNTAGLIANTAKLGATTVKSSVALAKGVTGGVSNVAKGIGQGINLIYAGIQWLGKNSKKRFEYTKKWLSKNMGPMLNDLVATYGKYAQRWQQLDSTSREALGILNSIGNIPNEITLKYHKNFNVQALAVFYHIIKDINTYMNSYIWTYFNFKYTNIEELIGNENNGNESILEHMYNFNNFIDEFISNEADDESELKAAYNTNNGQPTWIRTSEIREFVHQVGKYFQNGGHGENIDINALKNFNNRLQAFAKSAKASSTYGDLTFAYCIFNNRARTNFKFPGAIENNPKAKNVFQAFANYFSNKKKNKNANNAGNMGSSAYIKTAICGLEDNGNTTVETFAAGNNDLNRFKEVCENWLKPVSDVTEACANMQKLLTENAKPMSRFTNTLLNGIPTLIKDLDRMAAELKRSNSGNKPNPANGGGAPNPQNNNSNPNPNPANGGAGNPNPQNGNASYEMDMYDDYAFEAGVNNPNTANNNGVGGGDQYLNELKTLFKDISSGIYAYQNVIQGVCSTYACYVRGFMSAVFEYVVDTETIINAIHGAAGTEKRKQNQNDTNNGEQQNGN